LFISPFSCSSRLSSSSSSSVNGFYYFRLLLVVIISQRMNEKKTQKKGAQGKDGFFDDGRLRLIFDARRKRTKTSIMHTLLSHIFALFSD